MSASSDNFKAFVNGELDTIDKEFNRILEESIDRAMNYHEERCSAPEELKKDCMNAYMGLFAEIMGEEMMKRRSKVKTLGMVIKF